jgi:AraC family transcriptional regulator, regulatory protein of adaptative response / methylated-DNA-[protein]-cysteine methyltransferase
MVAVEQATGLCLLEFRDRLNLDASLSRLEKQTGAVLIQNETALLSQLRQQLDQYFSGRRQSFDLPLSLHSTAFNQKVWRQVVTIPYGQTRTYGQIAAEIHSPLAVRAVGRANGLNPLAIIIPCHRLVGADGSLRGYGGGLERKQALLALEKRGLNL